MVSAVPGSLTDRGLGKVSQTVSRNLFLSPMPLFAFHKIAPHSLSCPDPTHFVLYGQLLGAVSLPFSAMFQGLTNTLGNGQLAMIR